jgi:hypothetical protein
MTPSPAGSVVGVRIWRRRDNDVATWLATHGPDICGRILLRVLKECVSDARLLFKAVCGLRLAAKPLCLAKGVGRHPQLRMDLSARI